VRHACPGYCALSQTLTTDNNNVDNIEQPC
jgi:hypothetical protein